MFSYLFKFIDVDECKEVPQKCDVNAKCENNVGGYVCMCDKGYSGDGSTCSGIVFLVFALISQLNAKNFLDIDECENPDACEDNSVCYNLIGSFDCECIDGFQNDGTGNCNGR